MCNTDPRDVLHKYWGYDNFRPLQLDIIRSVLDGYDTLGLMPTGGGKSITFQVPALILPGLTLVITPLISLMKDQVDNLRNRGIKAGALYMGQPHREQHTVYDRARLGKIKLLYISPERLRSESFRAELSSWSVSLIVVDEAHCISQWGYDFRPSYLRIAELRKFFSDVPVLALTASATPIVRRDIIESLEFGTDHHVFTLSFHRNNLHYVVRNTYDKDSKLIEALSSVGGTAIVYVRSRVKTAKIAEMLNEAGIPATFYHAGLDPKVKEERQQMWKTDKIRVIVATNAFGMGIDKPDVRLVVHMDIPPTLEEYYQEAGRAGRDGYRAYALLIASPGDKSILSRRIAEAFPPRDFIVRVYETACNFMDIPVGEGYDHVYEFDLPKFCRTFSFQPEQVRGALSILTNAGWLDYVEEPAARGRVTMLVLRDELYRMTLEKNEQEVINAIFRLYPGLFADYIPINEDTVAALAELDNETVYQALLSLTRKRVLHYVPKRLLPYIYMPTSRELPKYITLPKSVYEDRRQLMENRIAAVRNFAFGAETCRDRILLEYFGETVVDDCGMCDVCVDRKRRAKQSEAPTDPDEAILRYLNRNPGASLGDITSELGARFDTDIIVNTIRTMIKRRVLRRDADRLYLLT